MGVLEGIASGIVEGDADSVHDLVKQAVDENIPAVDILNNGLVAGTDPVAVETVCLKILTEKRNAIRGEPWPLSPPPICVEAADKIYGLGTSLMEEIKIKHYGWEEGILL